MVSRRSQASVIPLTTVREKEEALRSRAVASVRNATSCDRRASPGASRSTARSARSWDKALAIATPTGPLQGRLGQRLA